MGNMSTQLEETHGLACEGLEERFSKAAGAMEGNKVKQGETLDTARLATASALQAMTQCASSCRDNDDGIAYAPGQRAMCTGIIQSHGSVLMVSSGPEFCGAPWGTVLAVSENSLEVLGVNPGDLLDRDLFDPDVSPFEGPTLESLRQALTGHDASDDPPAVHGSMRHKGGFIAHVVAHRTEEGFVIDIEPHRLKNVASVIQGQLQTTEVTRAAATRVQKVSADSIQEQCRALVNEVAALTGYERVMVMKIHPDDHGEVIAEFLKEGVSGPLVGLHFPASDMPQENEGTVRSTMRTRMIADVSKSSVAMMQSERLEENIDLSGSRLRGVDRRQMHYLGNMGVTATMNVALMVTGRSLEYGLCADNTFTAGRGRAPSAHRPSPWGLLVCQDYTGSRFVGHDQRFAVEFLASIFSTQLGRKLDADAQASQERPSRAQLQVVEALHATEGFGPSLGEDLAAVLMPKRGNDLMLQVAEATGCAMRLEGKWYMVGECPDAAHLCSVVQWMKDADKLDSGGRYGSISLLRSGFPGAEATKATMAGVLAADLDCSSSGSANCTATQNVALWMRGEVIRENIVLDKERIVSLGSAREEVRSGCDLWSIFDMDSAQGVQEVLQDTIRLRREGLFASRTLMALYNERIHAKSEVCKATEELRTAIGEASMPVVRLDPDLNIMNCNESAKTLSGAADSPGMPFISLLEGPCKKKAEVRRQLLMPPHSHLKVLSAPRHALPPRHHKLSFPPILLLFLCNTGGAQARSGGPGHQGPRVRPGRVQRCSRLRIRRKTRHPLHPHPPHRLGQSGVHCADLPRHELQEGERRSCSYIPLRCPFPDPEVSLSPLPLPSPHTPLPHLVCLQRLSRRKSSIRNAQDFLKSYPSPIFCIGSEGEVTEWSEALVEITGLDRLSVLGKSAVGEVFGRNGLLQTATNTKRDEFATEKLLALLASARQGYGNDSDGHEHSVIFSFHRKDNKRQVDVSFSCRPRLGPEGAAFGAFVFVKDLTTANALEKAVAVKLASEATVESKKRHTAFLCHEIQQPVNGILATMEAMQDAMTSESDTIDCTEIVELLSLTASCMDQLCLTIDCSLDTKEIEVNSLQAKPAPFQLTRTLRAVVSQIVKTAHEKGLSVECIINDPELRVMKVLGDTLRIQQILANFCWNSVKFTSEGSITVSLECDPSRVTEPGFKHFIFKVADTGMGMDEELQERLFQKPGLIGARSSSSGKLGLDISRKLAELMGGQVRCTSVPGKGSTFSLELDLEIDTNSSTDHVTVFTSGEFSLPSGKSDPDMNRLLPPSIAELRFPRTPRNSLDTGFIAAIPATPSVMQQQPLPPPPPHAAHAAAAAAAGLSGTSPQHVPLQYVMAPPPLPPHAAAAAFSGSPPRIDPPQQHCEKHMMANPWASGSHVYQPPYYYGGFMPQAPPNAMVPPFRVVRETVCDNSAAVLIEMHSPNSVWQQWGSATVVNGDTSSALRAAADDATRRIANCPQIQQPQVPMMPGYQYVPAVPMAAFPPQPPAAAGFHQAAQPTQTSQHQGAQIAPAAPAPPHCTVPPSAS